MQPKLTRCPLLTPPHTHRAQSNIKQLQDMVLVLMAVEGVLVCLSAAAYVVWLLRRVSVQRAALFTVFLTIPNGFLKQLANRNIKVSAEEDGDDGEPAGWLRVQDGARHWGWSPAAVLLGQPKAPGACLCRALAAHVIQPGTHMPCTLTQLPPPSADDDEPKPEPLAADKPSKQAPSEAGGVASRRNSVANLGKGSEAGPPRAPAGKGIRFSVEDAPLGGAGSVEPSGQSYAGRLQALLAGSLDADEDQSVIANKILNGERVLQQQQQQAGVE